MEKPTTPETKRDAGMKKWIGPARIECMEEVTAFVEGALEEIGAPMKIAVQMNIAVDEIFSNIARYSGALSATVGVKKRDDCLVLRFSDDGTPYDPTRKGDPDITLSAEERDIGGLGIFMVKKSMDSVVYEYLGGLNVLTLTKRLAP